MKGVDGVRVGKPPGARGGIQILGMVRGEWLRLVPQAVRVLLRPWLCEWVLLRLWCCAGVPLRRWHCAWVLLRLWLFAWVLLRLGAWARVLLRWWLCARVQPRLRACRSTSSGSVASACCWTVCSRRGVASFCEGSFFSVSRHSLASLSAV